MHNGEEPKELSGMQSQSLSKIRHHLTMLHTLQNSRLEVMEIIIKSITGLKIVLTPQEEALLIYLHLNGEFKTTHRHFITCSKYTTAKIQEHKDNYLT